MATIDGTSEDIGDAYAASLNAALAQLWSESGVRPVVRTPYGGQRTEAQQRYLISIGLSTTMQSDHLASKGGRAVDIDNYAAIQARIGVARFKAIMAAHGWFNVQINGAPFPTEPWHYANHSTAAAGGSATPLPIGTPTMSAVLYYQLNTRYLYALAGTSPGTDANWLETSDNTIAGQWAKLCNGARVDIAKGTWDLYKAWYQQPLKIRSV